MQQNAKPEFEKSALDSVASALKQFVAAELAKLPGGAADLIGQRVLGGNSKLHFAIDLSADDVTVMCSLDRGDDEPIDGRSGGTNIIDLFERVEVFRAAGTFVPDQPRPCLIRNVDPSYS